MDHLKINTSKTSWFSVKTIAMFVQLQHFYCVLSVKLLCGAPSELPVFGNRV
jgi:hypothetical protein